MVIVGMAGAFFLRQAPGRLGQNRYCDRRTCAWLALLFNRQQHSHVHAEDFTFKVNLVAVVRVRADDESVARKIVPTVLGALGTVEIRLANENNAAGGHHATVTDVDFSIGSVKPFRAGSR